MTPALRVLIVDDDPHARALHARFVAELDGFTVAANVGTGIAAIAVGSREDIDLILLDLRLPDVSGIEVLHRIRTQSASPPDVIVISSSRDQITVRQALAGRVAGYLIKPFSQEVFAHRLAVYRNERIAPDPSERDEQLAQSEVDRLLATGRVRVSPQAAYPSPPKGISAVTLERVRASLDPVVAASASDIAERCDMSRASARRYLDHLVGEGTVARSHRYGKRGRPEVLYRFAPGS
ncbi:MAG: response regulator [Microbacterium gubbeenense]|uniref:response regulator n=1 Tax=Microbacterium gubbeenense TaxID=159896 RepID=UPI003F9A6D00